MAFTSASDFNKVPYRLANLDVNPLLTEFAAFVADEEPTQLKLLLGGSLYTQFAAGLLEDPIEQRWVDLRDGASYLYNGKSYTWLGMKALLKPFIYAKWIEEKTAEFTGAGMTTAKVENADKVSPRVAISKAWLQFRIIAGNYLAQENTLYGYLYNVNAQNGTFDDTFDETFQSFNAYLEFSFKAPGSRNYFNL